MCPAGNTSGATRRIESKRACAGGEKMDLHCPKCNSSNLRKVSLAYQEGLSHGGGHARLRAAVIAGSGPDLVVGRACTRAFQQSVLSKQLGPPVKWSYRKAVGWLVLAFLCLGWLLFYTNAVATNATKLVWAPLVFLGFVACSALAGILFLAWRHNHSSYPRKFAEWNRSFICQRCGAVSQQRSRPFFVEPFLE